MPAARGYLIFLKNKYDLKCLVSAWLFIYFNFALIVMHLLLDVTNTVVNEL